MRLHVSHFPRWTRRCRHPTSCPAPNLVSARKAEHLAVIASRDVESRTPAGWDDVRLIHSALPEIDLAEVDTGTDLLGRRLRLPLVIASMTGGHSAALAVNRVLARAAETYGIAMGVGSQRAALRDRALRYTYAVVRQEAPGAFIIANIGAPQLVEQDGVPPLSLRDVEAIVAMVGADALAIHLNYLEEAVMTEGDRRARGCRAAIARLAGGAGGAGHREGDRGRAVTRGRAGVARRRGPGARRRRARRDQLRRRRGGPAPRRTATRAGHGSARCSATGASRRPSRWWRRAGPACR